MNFVVDLINRRLKNLYGLNLYNDPNFRVVFSDHQTEKRYGKYNLFYGHIFLREETGLHERKKYPYIHAKWILERWFPPSQTYHQDIPESSRGSYEPLYVFQDKFGNYLPPIWKATEMIVNCIINPESYNDRKIRLANEEEVKEQKEYQEIYDSLDTGSSLMSALHTHEAVGYTGDKKK